MTTLLPATTPIAVEGLRALSPQPLPFAPSLEIRSFVLQRPRGDVLVYGAPVTAREAQGVTRRYLVHGHEAMFATDLPGVPLFVHEADRESVAASLAIRGTFTRRHLLDEDLELIPLPGHTPGTAAVLWDSGGRRVLFAGDTIMLRDGEWVTAVLDSSDRVAYRASLELIRELDFDVLAPWAASTGGPFLAVTDDADRRRRVDELIAQLVP